MDIVKSMVHDIPQAFIYLCKYNLSDLALEVYPHADLHTRVLGYQAAFRYGHIDLLNRLPPPAPMDVGYDTHFHELCLDASIETVRRVIPYLSKRVRTIMFALEILRSRYRMYRMKELSDMEPTLRLDVYPDQVSLLVNLGLPFSRINAGIAEVHAEIQRLQSLRRTIAEHIRAATNLIPELINEIIYYVELEKE